VKLGVSQVHVRVQEPGTRRVLIQGSSSACVRSAARRTRTRSRGVSSGCVSALVAGSSGLWVQTRSSRLSVNHSGATKRSA
jgi:hypothetical protein